MSELLNAYLNQLADFRFALSRLSKSDLEALRQAIRSEMRVIKDMGEDMGDSLERYCDLTNALSTVACELFKNQS